jgi:CO dehydrogenase maturation factor
MSSDATGYKNKVIAVCGKGGVGKTAFTALLAKALLEREETGRLLLIDADPALGLANALGNTVNRTIGQVREAVIETAKNGEEEDVTEMAGMLDYMILESLVERDDYALLAMGRSESQGCYCSVNNLLRDAIRLLSEKFDTILIDGEAGLEQINRQVVDRLDCLIILTDGSARGFQTVSLLENMVAKEQVVKCGKHGVVFNRLSSNETFILQSAAKAGMNIFGTVPPDNTLADYDIRGQALSSLPDNNPALTAVRSILNSVISQ